VLNCLSEAVSQGNHFASDVAIVEGEASNGIAGRLVIVGMFMVGHGENFG
jgi:hypothetical protein